MVVFTHRDDSPTSKRNVHYAMFQYYSLPLAVVRLLELACWHCACPWKTAALQRTVKSLQFTTKPSTLCFPHFQQLRDEQLQSAGLNLNTTSHSTGSTQKSKSPNALHRSLYFVSSIYTAPVAMMVTWISPSYSSSTTAPKMMLHEGSARPVTTSDTRFTSWSVRSFPPVMLYTIPERKRERMHMKTESSERPCKRTAFIPKPAKER